MLYLPISEAVELEYNKSLLQSLEIKGEKFVLLNSNILIQKFNKCDFDLSDMYPLALAK